MEKNIKLTYYQVMIFIKEIDKLKKEDENFSDETSRSFELYVLNRTKELVLKYPGIVMDLKGVLKLYTISDKIAANNMMDLALSRLIVLMNNYPELKSNKNITALMDELAGTENRISIERDRYNQLVMEYNKTIKYFPKNIIASAFHFEEKPYFKADTNAQTAPKVEL